MTTSKPSSTRPELPSLEQVRAQKARRRLTDWCRYVDDSYVVAKHHRALADALEAVERGEVKRLVVSMPPRHGKSLTSTVRFPSWFLGRNPDKRVIITAHTASLAQSFSRRARNEVAEHGSSVFGVSLAGDSAATNSWSLQGRRGGVIAAGVGGPITGHGADLLLIDDPVKDAQAAESETQRQNVVDWYTSTARTRVHPGGAVVVVMTRWHEADLAGWLLAQAKAGAGESWETINLPMLTDEGGILWPERYTSDEVAGIRHAVGTRVWESLYQGRPTPGEGAILKREWWMRWRELPPVIDEVVISVDATFKDGDASDFVVMQAWARHKTAKYLVAQRRDRMGFSATCQVLKDFVAEIQARLGLVSSVVVEDAANGPAIIDSLRSKIGGLVAVRPEGGKVARARNVEAQVEAGQVWIPAEGAWVGEFVEECASFPNGKHDDQVDAMTQALIRMSRNTDWVPKTPEQRAQGAAPAAAKHRRGRSPGDVDL